MKTAVSIPDPVFNEAETLAKRLGISRSRLYARALQAFVAGNSPDEITDAMNAAVAAAAGERDEFVREAGRRTFERVEW